MHSTHTPSHYWILVTATVLAVGTWMLPKPAHSQNGFYTTNSTSTSTSSTTNGVTTTTTNTNTSAPTSTLGDQRWRNARNSGDESTYRNRAARDEDPDSNNTSDVEARYPYDNTNGRHRSDVDAARTGFDDPRNPWDGRYMNDNPSNAMNSNDKVNAMRGNETSRNLGNDRYRAGRYGTYSIRR